MDLVFRECIQDLENISRIYRIDKISTRQIKYLESMDLGYTDWIQNLQNLSGSEMDIETIEWIYDLQNESRNHGIDLGYRE